MKVQREKGYYNYQGRKRYPYHPRNREKAKDTVQNYTQQQLAQLNLIEISNFDYSSEPVLNEQKKQQQNTQELPTTRRVKERRIFYNAPRANKSTQLRISVTKRMTESFKAGMRPSHSQLRTDNVCILKRKMPVSISSYLILQNKDKVQHVTQMPLQVDKTVKNFYKPRPAINIRNFCSKKWNKSQSVTSRKDDDLNSTASNFRSSSRISCEQNQNRKRLEPIEQSYWKIYSKSHR